MNELEYHLCCASRALKDIIHFYPQILGNTIKLERARTIVNILKETSNIFDCNQKKNYFCILLNIRSF